MSRLLIVRDWDRHFENNRTRELKFLNWVPFPNRQDGDGYTELLDHADGAAHFGAWIAIIQIASKCDPRGTLIRDVPTIPQEGATGPAADRSRVRPHDSDSLGRMSRIPSATMNVAVERLLHIGWLIAQPVETQDDTAIPQEGATLPRTIPQEGATKRRPPNPNPNPNPTPRSEQNTKRASEALAPAATAKGDRSGKGDQPKRRKKPAYTPEFERAWAAYGRRGTKPKAAKRFDEAVKLIASRDDAPADPTQWLIERTGTYVTLHDAGDERRFRLYYERWLEGEKYDFDEDEMRKASGGSSSGSLDFMHEQTQKMLADERARFQAPGDTAP